MQKGNLDLLLSLWTEVYLFVYPLYGGRSVSAPLFDNERARLVRPEALVIGDVILFDGACGEKIYVFAGDYILDLATGERIESVKEFLEGLLGVQNYFGIIRPSLKF